MLIELASTPFGYDNYNIVGGKNLDVSTFSNRILLSPLYDPNIQRTGCVKFDVRDSYIVS